MSGLTFLVPATQLLAIVITPAAMTLLVIALIFAFATGDLGLLRPDVHVREEDPAPRWRPELRQSTVRRGAETLSDRGMAVAEGGRHR